MDNTLIEDQFYAIITILNGSWLYNALHDVPLEYKQRIVSEFIDNHSQHDLDQLVHHVATDHIPATLPDMLKQ